jgi:hypothetical protein
MHITREQMLARLEQSQNGTWTVILERGDSAYDPETADTLLGPCTVAYRFDISGTVPGAGPYRADVRNY